MIVGVGIDIVEIEKAISRIDNTRGFAEKIFSKAEIEYCESAASKRAERYAARFSAKEAFLKAAGDGLTLTHDLHEIEVMLNAKGKPEIRLTGGLSNLTLQRGWTNIHVSLSHTHNTACAVVVIETSAQ